MAPSAPIIGHTKQQEQLTSDLLSGKVASAYLFAGKRYVGKMTLARRFAAQMLTEGLNEEDAKNQLRQMRKNIHGDLLILDQLWIEDVCTDWDVIARSSNIPQQHRAKAKVKTDTIGIDDIRAIQERMHETASRKRRCCIIRRVERLHITAANALLKILEEPPPNATFLLTTESLSSIPETILSRMRILKLHPVPTAELRPLVAAKNEEDAALILDAAQGAPGIVLRCMEDPAVLRAYKQMSIHALHFLDAGSPVEQLNLITDLLEKNEEEDFFRALLLQLQKRLRSEDASVVSSAIRWMEDLQILLRHLESNAQKQLVLRDFILRRSFPAPTPA